MANFITGLIRNIAKKAGQFIKGQGGAAGRGASKVKRSDHPPGSRGKGTAAGRRQGMKQKAARHGLGGFLGGS